MRRRPTITNGKTTSSRHTSNPVDHVVAALQRKLSINHIETSLPAPESPRRVSFSMDSILHPQRHKKNDEAKDRESRKDKHPGLQMRPGSAKSKDRGGPSPSPGPVTPAKLQTTIESPPLVFIGSVSNSTGALLSGLLRLTIEGNRDEITLTNFTMILRATSTTKKPVGKDCQDCAERHEELKKWDFLSEPKTFYKSRDNAFPYSYLLPGHLPASTVCQLGSISYALVAKATTSNGEHITLQKPLTVSRAIPQGPEKSSIRIFPPTNLTGRAIIPPVVYPIGTFPVTMTLSGIVEKKIQSQTRWRLRKLMWRIEEHSKVVSTPCSKHTHKVSDGKSLQHVDTKVLGYDEMKTGWKTDFDTIGGEIMVEFDASISTKPSHKPTCDVDSSSGIEVKHNLVVELIVAEEFCPNRNTQLITPTGAARVLRMNFSLALTERAGMGIAWDEEQPPMYEDVPPSPPGYGSSDRNDGAFGGAIMEDYNGPEIEYEELERVPTVSGPPVYRERDPLEIASRRSRVNLRSGLPMRSDSTQLPDQGIAEDGQAGPSGTTRRAGWTLDELENAEALYLPRRRSDPAEENGAEEDYGEGESGAVQQGPQR